MLVLFGLLSRRSQASRTRVGAVTSRRRSGSWADGHQVEVRPSWNGEHRAMSQIVCFPTSLCHGTCERCLDSPPLSSGSAMTTGGRRDNKPHGWCWGLRGLARHAHGGFLEHVVDVEQRDGAARFLVNGRPPRRLGLSVTMISEGTHHTIAAVLRRGHIPRREERLFVEARMTTNESDRNSIRVA